MLIWTEILPRKSWLTTSLGSCIQLWLAVFRHLSDYQFEYLSNLWNLQPILHWINVSGLLLRAGFRRFNYSIAIQFQISQECQWYTWLEMWERTDWRPASSPQVRQGGQSTHWHTERRTQERSVNTQGTLGTPVCSAGQMDFSRQTNTISSCRQTITISFEHCTKISDLRFANLCK